jgi:hypothetical protein
MARDGTQTYNLPFPDVVADTTIESTVYNGFTHDIANDLNAPRPIKFGGTGAATIAAARTNLATEVASAVVTNYSSHVFEAGSFYSAAGATAAPTANAFSGICYKVDANNLVIELRDTTTNIKYFRRRTAGAWSPSFTVDGTGSFVELGGDTMTGTLNITNGGTFNITPGAGLNPLISLNKVSGQINLLRGTQGSSARWDIFLGDSSVESGSNVGSNLQLVHRDDAGTSLGTALVGVRSTGLLTVKADPTAALGIATKQMVDLKAPITNPDFIGRIDIYTKPFASYGANYNTIYEPASVTAAILIGPSTGDAANYYRNDTHYFQNKGVGTTPFMTMNASGNTSHVAMNVPTATAPDNSTKAASTAWVRGYAQPVDAQLFAGIPPIIKTGPVSTIASDAQKILLCTGAITIADTVHTAGTCLTFYANGSAITIANTAAMWFNQGGAALSGTRTLSNVGVATAIKLPGFWVISGNGLS